MAGEKSSEKFFLLMLSRLIKPIENLTWLAIGVFSLFLALGIGVYYLWLNFGEQVISHQDYEVQIDDIELTATPPWIKADVRYQAYSRGSLESLTILDEKLTVRVANAFGLHPWVREVKRVTKLNPSTVKVEVVYYRPIAFVQVGPGYVPGDPDALGLVAVDADGVLLPHEDFISVDLDTYPRILAGNTEPSGGVPGRPWGDPLVTGAANIIDVLGDHWKELNLTTVVASDDPQSNPRAADSPFHLYLQRQTLVIWGQAPGKEKPGEPSAKEKLKRLLRIVRSRGTLNPPQEPSDDNRTHPIDLRYASGQPGTKSISAVRKKSTTR